jgi:undecaprenyl-diphosphatase
MTYWQALVLGLVQGLTEFLPVSSSGHLALMEGVLGVPPGDLLFEIVIHVATLVAVVSYYRKDIAHMFRGLFSRHAPEVAHMTSWRWLAILVVGTIPAAVLGLAFKSEFEASFADLRGIGFQFLATGALLFSTVPLVGKRLKIGVGRSFAIGIAQAVAILPAVSRSGSTIATAMWLDIDREQAARYSFLLSIPAIGGAFVLQMYDLAANKVALPQADWGPLALAFVVSGVSGYFAVAAILRALTHRWFAHFGIWCWLVGLAALWRW